MSDGVTAPIATGTMARPWRCPACRYAVPHAAIGDRCSECGQVLDERSVRPAWAAGEGLATLGRAARRGLLGNLALAALPLLMGFLIAAQARSIVVPFVLLAAVCLCVWMHLSATRAIGRLGGVEPSVARLRTVAWWRLGAVAATPVLLLSPWMVRSLPGFDPWWDEWGILIFLFILTMLAVHGAIAACDVMLAIGVRTIGRRGLLEPVWWHRPVLSAAPVMLAACALLSIAPMLGWLLGLMGLGIANAATFLVLASIAGRLRRLERATAG
jgi:hypothetical protein